MLITAMTFSPDGSLLAVGNNSGKIVVYRTNSWEVETDRWSSHTARVMSIGWNHAGTHAASVGLDTNLYVWSIKSPGKRVKYTNAHKDGVYGVYWMDARMLATAGGDAALKIWEVSGLQ
jgi:WD40 repeat protein